jgi:pimeloyl-ACP methyl ester carboxylesterase
LFRRKADRNLFFAMHVSSVPKPNERPKLLLVPQLTEVEWLIQPLLEEWAEVASYDVPGVGGEPPVDDFGPEAVAARGLAELDRRGWQRCVLVVDEFGAPAAAVLASRRPEAIQAVAFGHARLSNAMEGDAPALNAEVFAACASLVRHDTKTFVRQLFKLTQGEQMRGGYGELPRPRSCRSTSTGLGAPRHGRFDRRCPSRARRAAVPRRTRWMPALHGRGLRGRGGRLPGSPDDDACRQAECECRVRRGPTGVLRGDRFSPGNMRSAGGAPRLQR